MSSVIDSLWINLKSPTLQIIIDNGISNETTMSLDWIKCIQKASVCQAGILLMQELETRLPLRVEESVDSMTDEDGSVAEENTVKRFAWLKRILAKVPLPSRSRKHKRSRWKQFKDKLV